ncbi:hypothetical protein HF847_01070 [Clostridium cochlearium]|uniref:hypothetical protein n=1 Tax=Clostridium cochlearium TaxID=1494 RepID=UPI001459FA67|nr:hypothetical protein [Clostridium cochlearium]NME94600.1 hypothetical protein [Clostridium cochlearium]
MDKEISKKEQDRIIQGALASAEELKKNMNKYFATVDKYFENMDKTIDKYFIKLDNSIDKLGANF